MQAPFWNVIRLFKIPVISVGNGHDRSAVETNIFEMCPANP